MKWVSIPAVVMAAVSLYVGFYYLWMYARRRTEDENLAFAVSCFTIALYDIFCAGLYNAASPEAGMFWQRLQFAALCMFTISVSWFFYHLTAFRSRAPFIAITVLLSVFFFLGVFIRNGLTLSIERPFVKSIALGSVSIIYNEVDPGIIYTLQYISMMLIAFFLFAILIQHYRGEEKQSVRPILVSMVLFLAASINDVMVGAGVYPFIYLMEYAYMFILISMANALQNRFFSLHHEVEELTHQLEEKVNDRTMELLLSEITHRLYAEMAGEPASAPPAGEAARQDELSSTVNSLSQDISIIMNIDKLLGRSLEKGAEIVGAERACLYMIDEAGKLDRAAIMGGETPDGWVPAAAERVLWENQHMVLNHHDAEGNPAGHDAALRHTLMVPVNLRGKAIGVCCAQRPAARETFTERDVRMAEMYMAQAASAIENAYLYQRMIDRNAAVRQQSVTPNIEEKMKKAIAFIRENYQSDISREGLAASLNMHPDSFGRFFKIYTNKKISEFINELRVMEATRRLSETDANIIEIAFAVGFESLPTFNRAFLKVMNVTPTQFREQKGTNA